MPENRHNQEILDKIEYSIIPELLTDQWEQQVAHFHITDIAAGKQIEIIETMKVQTFNVSYFVFPDQVGPLSAIPQDIMKKYLVNDIKYQYDHPVIQKALIEAVGEEKNPYWITRNIYDYLRPAMYYEMTGGWNTAPTVLARGNDSCSEYTFVYIAMCRAAGVPARYVGALELGSEKKNMDNLFHRWVEVYLPNYGWIPVDPAAGDQEAPATQVRYFGRLSNGFLITTQSGGGSEYMGWTYNSNQEYTTEPKTYVVHEYFGDCHQIDPE